MVCSCSFWPPILAFIVRCDNHPDNRISPRMSATLGFGLVTVPMYAMNQRITAINNSPFHIVTLLILGHLAHALLMPSYHPLFIPHLSAVYLDLSRFTVSKRSLGICWQ